MSFISLSFLIFFAFVTFLYFALPHKWRWLLLLIASCIFYLSFIPVYIFLLFFLIVIDYFAAIFISKSKGKKRKTFLIISILSTVSALFIFKYHDFFVINFQSIGLFLDWNYSPKLLKLILPVGLSFHTFQSLAYVIEVYRRKQKPERHFGIYALYVMFYPQLMAGPIERPGHMLHQFKEKHNFDYTRVIRGLRLMLWGGFEKVIIADQAAKAVNLVYGDPTKYSGLVLIWATILFAFQIFCDFDGYSNIARGAARVMGFDLIKNFNRPYFAGSFKEFWQRWHISLSTWFRDYFYIPLGGSRVLPLRHAFNIMASFLVSGFWHGANWTFVIWGGLHGSYLLLSDWAVKITKRPFPSFLTFPLVTLAWVFFRAESFKDALYIISHFPQNLGADLIQLITQGFSSIPTLLAQQEKVLGLAIINWAILVGSILFLMLVHKRQDTVSIQKYLEKKSQLTRWAIYYALVLIIVYFAAKGREHFIYFQF